MKFRVLIILIIFFSSITKASTPSIGEAYNKEIKFHKSKFSLPFSSYILTNHTVTEVNYGYNFEEFFLTNKETNNPEKIADDLQKLNNLYKSKAISSDEFEKAKLKILK